jgi:response regulator RpfG family c-di-GMP phosphodiesterase
MTPAPLSILIVDDQPSVVAALEAVLRELFPEAELLTAGSAEEAWELIQRHRPAIVLCDIVLPGETSGLGLCQRIKATPELASTYVILMTAFDTAEWREAALYQYRADAYLRKPFRIAELQEKLEAAFHALQSRPQPQQDIVLTASDELLQLLQTLLEIRSPALRQLSTQIHHCCQWLADHAEGLEERERLLLPHAGTVYPVGRLALPDSLLYEPMTHSGHLAHELLVQIPLAAAAVCRQHSRLLPLVQILEAVTENYDGTGFPHHLRAWEIPLPARLLRLAVDFEELLWSTSQEPLAAAVHLERFARQAYDPQLLPLLRQYAVLRQAGATARSVALHELREGMRLLCDVQTRSGIKLLPSGTVLTSALIERLLRHHVNDPIVGVLIVQPPAEEA